MAARSTPTPNNNTAARSALPDPLEQNPRPKPLTVVAETWAPRPVLDEKMSGNGNAKDVQERVTLIGLSRTRCSVLTLLRRDGDPHPEFHLLDKEISRAPRRKGGALPQHPGTHGRNRRWAEWIC